MVTVKRNKTRQGIVVLVGSLLNKDLLVSFKCFTVFFLSNQMQISATIFSKFTDHRQCILLLYLISFVSATINFHELIRDFRVLGVLISDNAFNKN